MLNTEIKQSLLILKGSDWDWGNLEEPYEKEMAFAGDSKEGQV